jgi:hypothetical protein
MAYLSKITFTTLRANHTLAMRCRLATRVSAIARYSYFAVRLSSMVKGGSLKLAVHTWSKTRNRSDCVGVRLSLLLLKKVSKRVHVEKLSKKEYWMDGQK